MKSLSEWFVKFILKRWRASLERRIDYERFDPLLSRKIDVILNMLDE